MKLVVEELEDEVTKEIPLEKKMSPLKQKAVGDRKHLSTRQKLGVAIIFFILFEMLFLLPLSVSTWYLTLSGRALQNQQTIKAQSYLDNGTLFLNSSKALYRLSKPPLSFFYLARLPDNLISIIDDGFRLVKVSIVTTTNFKTLATNILSSAPLPKTEAPQQISLLKSQTQEIATTARHLERQLDVSTLPLKKLHAKIDFIASRLEEVAQFSAHIDTLLGQGKTARYVVFFYNNMELRPGGGFLGSFALVTFNSYKLSEFTVFDVYDADGQLKSHIDPPTPISRYLRQPHFFLRDSNFTPDFPENVKSAQYFLERELGITNLNGAIGLTTTSMSYFIEAFEPLYVPDLKQTVTKDNFYLKTQAASENDSFAGSKQKKDFLSSLTRQMMLSFDHVDGAKLATATLKSLQEKQLVIFSSDGPSQQEISHLRWGGTLVSPYCVTTSTTCLINHIFPVDANLGVNKANLFITRLIKQTITINESGKINNKMIILYNNKSPEKTFPGGDYVNYFQLYFPSEAQSILVGENGKEILSYDLKRSGKFQVLGLAMTVASGKQGVIEVDYSESSPVPKGRSIYQLLVQKQIGLVNTDVFLEIHLPKNITAVDTNFESVAKIGSIIYNTVLSSDKLFLIELSRAL